MITFLFILSLYSAILSTFLFGRWVRTAIIRRQVRIRLKREMVSPEREAFLKAHPPVLLPSLKREEIELEGEVVRGFEVEIDWMEKEEIEETVEEREYREEIMSNLKRGNHATI